MNKKLYMTLVNAIAKVIVIEGTQKGAYYAKLSIAHKIVRNGQLDTVNELVDIPAIIERVESPSVTKSPKMPNKVYNKKREGAEIAILKPAQKIVFNGLPASLYEHFEAEQLETVSEFITRFVEHANKHTDVYLDEKNHVFNDGMNALERVTDMIGLQSTMLTYFFT